MSSPAAVVTIDGPMRVREPRAQIAGVEPGSIADQLGVRPGDRLARINGEPPRDVIDYQLWTAAEELELVFETAGGETLACAFQKDPAEDLGLTFADELFVPLRTCNNGCLFCFVLQAPVGLRPTVYVKDDDYRLSFLHGNFTTLTNLTEAHFERIVAQRLSPLYVSVHASDPALRRQLLDNQKADAGWDYLVRLCAAGIECHTQIVVCPGLNDAAELDRTIGDVARLRPAVQTIGVVPVGLTRFQAHPLMRPMTAAEAAATLDQVDAQRARLGSRGDGFVYAADEQYLNASLPLPPAAYYDGFAQIENGIGPSRLLLDQVAEALRRLPHKLPKQRVAVLTGGYGATLLADFAAALRGIESVDLELIPVRNELFGGNVSCAGLLCGRDMLAALAGRPPFDRVILPARALNDEGVLLDDLTPHDLAARLGIPVGACATPAEVVAVLRGGR
ncbi:MAG: DUF512 domain-containing protein [Armatimonadetes bacterium]|nr:DUF512 domain-containing protein [Armatimonadota bacterium]